MRGVKSAFFVHKYKYIICSFLINIEYLSFKRNIIHNRNQVV